MPEKTLLLESQGYQIYTVDGEEVRKDFSVAFMGGDNWSHNKKIPKGQVWIEKSLRGTDRANIVLHELVEAELMAEFDMDYDEAHLVANTIESFHRKTEDLATALATLGEATGLPAESLKKITAAVTELPSDKTAAAQPVWLGGARPETPETADAGDPYDHYLSRVLRSPSRRGALFDLATGTRYTGLRGIKDRVTEGASEYGSMSVEGLDPSDKRFGSGMSGAMRKYLGKNTHVEQLFGRLMSPTEAIAAVGVTNLPYLKNIASDPMTWAKAFGRAAKTPAEQVRAKRMLHAAASLYSGVKGTTAFDPRALKAWWAGVPLHAQAKLRLAKGLRQTDDGLKSLPSITDIMSAPMLNPQHYVDNFEAAQQAAKLSAEDAQRVKIAEELKGSYSAAVHAADPEDHLYHVEKREGKVVGMIKVAPKPEGHYHITNFWVRPGMRSQGIGSRLMKKVLELYDDKELTLDSEVFDKSPLTQKQLDAFYEKFGFVKTDGARMRRAPRGAKEARWLGQLGKLFQRATPAQKALRALPPYQGRDLEELLDGLRMAKARRYNPPKARQMQAALQAQGRLRSIDELESRGFRPAQAQVKTAKVQLLRALSAAGRQVSGATKRFSRDMRSLLPRRATAPKPYVPEPPVRLADASTMRNHRWSYSGDVYPDGRISRTSTLASPAAKARTATQYSAYDARPDLAYLKRQADSAFAQAPSTGTRDTYAQLVQLKPEVQVPTQAQADLAKYFYSPRYTPRPLTHATPTAWSVAKGRLGRERRYVHSGSEQLMDRRRMLLAGGLGTGAVGSAAALGYPGTPQPQPQPPSIAVNP